MAWNLYTYRKLAAVRKPQFRKAVRGSQVSRTQSIPAPVGGWNARDSAANMSELDATIMLNWFPETNDIRVRKGWADHVTGITGQVESLMAYNKPDGTQTLFAAAGSVFKDVTSAGAVGADVVTGLTNARWQSANFTVSDGTSYLCCFNGADAPQYWNGSAWIAITDVSTPAITGITATTIVNVDVHKRRMWLTVTDSLKAYYLPVDSVGGEAKAIDLGGIARKGGFIQATGTWTLDAGEGADDYWAAFTSEGQVVVYRGTDPSSSSTWSLHGVWDVGEPIGRRCVIKYNGDILFITVNGVLPLSKLIVSASTDPNVAITEKINKAMTDASSSYKTNYGWQLLQIPQEDMILLNVPVLEGSVQEQYAMNTITGSWGQFRGIDANCWTIFNEKAYFGSSTTVGVFGDVLADNGSNIEGDMRQAENYFKSKGRLKYFKSTRPIFLANGTPAVLAGMNVDFADTALVGALSFSPLTQAVWDVAMWDVGLWGGGLSALKDWQTIGSVGTSGAFRLNTVSNGIEVRFESSDHVFEFGGVIA